MKRSRPMKRRGPKYTTHAKLWEIARECVFLRDGKRCAVCHKPAERAVIQVHHIKPKGSNPRLRYRLENLVPVCKGCHFAKIHGTDARESAKVMEGLVTPDLLERLDLLAQAAKGTKGPKVSLEAERLYLLAERERLTKGQQ